MTARSTRAVFLSLLGVIPLWGCSSKSATPVAVETRPAKPSGGLPIETQIDNFCGACHPTPRPEQFPKTWWRKEVELGYRLYFESDREKLPVPVMSEVISWYERRAPAKLPTVMAYPDVNPGGLRLRPEVIARPAGDKPPAVSNISWHALRPNEPRSLIISDMRSGEIWAHRVGSDDSGPRRLAQLNHPAHVESCDLDEDGTPELLVADLGSYLPADHSLGRVVWLRPVGQDGRFEPLVLADGLGRVADVRAHDFTGDSQADLLVAEFGWRRTGRVRLLVQQDGKDGIPKFEDRQIDPRHGAIHIPIWDANEDGHADFATVFSQEHEVVELFLGDGQGGFRNERLFAGGLPSFGSSGLNLVDLDGDGDQDLLFTNGDMFDETLLRDFHGVHWLENRGSDGWKHERLTALPAAHGARAADMDGDGDLDVVACAFMPEQLEVAPGLSLASLVWIERSGSEGWKTHVLELNNSQHACLEVGDFDGDLDPDLAVGNYSTDRSSNQNLYTVWWNE